MDIDKPDNSNTQPDDPDQSKPRSCGPDSPCKVTGAYPQQLGGCM